MKNYFLFLVLALPLIFGACSKKEGCRDINALNFDASAEKDGTCQYTKVMFYAPGNRVGGNGEDVVKIEIRFGGSLNTEEPIATITKFNQGEPTGCVAPDGAFEYQLSQDDTEGRGIKFLTRYYFESGDWQNRDTYELAIDRNFECHKIPLTLP